MRETTDPGGPKEQTTSRHGPTLWVSYWHATASSIPYHTYPPRRTIFMRHARQPIILRRERSASGILPRVTDPPIHPIYRITSALIVSRGGRARWVAANRRSCFGCCDWGPWWMWWMLLTLCRCRDVVEVWLGRGRTCSYVRAHPRGGRTGLIIRVLFRRILSG